LSSIYYVTRGAGTLAGWTPQGARHVLGSAISAVSYLGWPSKRRVTQLNMAQVTGRPVDDPYVRHLALASWWNYGRYAADFLNFPHLDLNAIEQQMRDLSEGDSWQSLMMPAIQAGRGAIITTAHFGNYDMAGALVARHLPLSAVVETFSDERLNQLVQNQRREKGIGIIPMEGSARRILRTLQQNQLVAIAVDRPVTPDEGTEVTFFGRKTYVPDGPAALALKSGAALIPGYMWYGQHNEFYVRMYPPIYPRESKREQKASEIARLTQCMYDTLEEMVRQWPTQWYMFRQFWPAE